jgi:anthranilate phosphoribosyltransferase
MNQTPYRDFLGIVIAGSHLTFAQAHEAFGQIMDGGWTEAQIGGFLAALAVKGETADEIAGAAAAMREHVVPVDAAGLVAVDTCGTGGTGLATVNVSTAAALVAAGAGVPVAKHGNRTNTRASGSADVLAALGVNIEAGADVVARCLREAGVGFCFAVKHHPAMKYAVPVRKQLAVRTVFNVLGPLTNPAGARRQVMGVFDAALTERIARVLGKLGAVRAMVVHADDGLDELSTVSETHVADWRDGRVTARRVRPEDFGLRRAKMEDLLVDSAERSADIIREVLAGRAGPARDIVVLNAAAALVVGDRADSIAAALPQAAEAIDSGAARAALDALIRVSNA